MNFRQVATEIMLHANEEKWYETRERIITALEEARLQAEVDYCDGLFRPKHGDFTARGGYPFVPVGPLVVDPTKCGPPVNPLWRDQPDGVR